MLGRPRSRTHGLTLVELLVVVGLVAILIGLAAPSMRGLISAKRVQGTTTELVTDLQYARSEALRRSHDVRVGFKATDSLSCYVLYIEPEGLPVENPVDVNGGAASCDCSRSGATGNEVCAAGREEIKTVQLQRSSGVALGVTSNDGPIIAFGSNSGAPVPLAPGGAMPGNFEVLVTGSAGGKLRTTVNAAGRPGMCTPDASISGVPPC